MKRLIIILWVMLTYTSVLSSQEMTVEQIKADIIKVSAQLKTIQCDFVQTKYLRMLNEKMISKGKMYYQQNDKLRWEYTMPYQYTFILNNTKVQLSNKDHNDIIDVRQNQVFKEIAKIMMNSVIGRSLSDNKDFTVSINMNNDECIATLTPIRKDIKTMFNEIQLYFNNKDYMVSKVILMEKNNDKTVIELQNIKTNAAIDTNIFDIM